MRTFFIGTTLLLLGTLAAFAADKPVTVRFQAQVGDQIFICGKQFDGVGITKSKITGIDFRFYISDVRLIDAAGKETPLKLDQDGKWQLDNLALLDFENAKGRCSNGNPEMNQQITGTAPEGNYTGLRFTLGVPFNKNHLDPMTQPSPLNLTALMWGWNAGHSFARLDFASAGSPRGFVVHLGSTGCTPDDASSIPTRCRAPNRVEVYFPFFDASRQIVIADLGALLQDTNVDATQNDFPAGAGCMSGPTTGDCKSLFANFGLPFGDNPPGKQRFFRVGSTAIADLPSRAAR